MQPMYEPEPVRVREKEAMGRLRSKFARTLAYLQNAPRSERDRLISQIESELDNVLPQMAGPLPGTIKCPKCGAEL